MESLYKIHLRMLRSIVHDQAPIGYAETRDASAWSPNVTIHRGDNRYLLFMELAGVGRAEISVQAEPYRLVVTGIRHFGPPYSAVAEARQILALEIDEGPFRREITFPEEIVPEAASAEQVNGILRIELPLRAGAQTPTTP